MFYNLMVRDGLNFKTDNPGYVIKAGRNNNLTTNKLIFKYQKMVSGFKYIISIFFLASLLPNAGGQSFKWVNAVPEDEGFSTEILYAMRDTLAMHKTTSILVIKD